MNLTNCRLSIGRDSDDKMRVTLVDRDSGVTFFSGEMSLEDFMRTITGQAERPFERAVLRGLERLGTTQEVRTVAVAMPKERTGMYSEDFATHHAAWAKPHEVDGWQADIDQRFNGHRSHGDTYKTVFRRWVAKEAP